MGWNCGSHNGLCNNPLSICLAGIFTARLQPVVTEKGNLLLLTSLILKTMIFMRCILYLCLCVCYNHSILYMFKETNLISFFINL